MCLAIPGCIESVESNGELKRSGKVRFGELLQTVNLSFVPQANIGDYVLVHAGFAISVIDEEEARRTTESFEELQRLINAESGSL